MARPELLSSFLSLSKKIDSLIEQQKKLQEKLESLELQNSELRKQHEEDVANLIEANKKIELLSLSYRLADSPQALISARKKIEGLIRTIDTCIRLINED